MSPSSLRSSGVGVPTRCWSPAAGIYSHSATTAFTSPDTSRAITSGCNCNQLSGSMGLRSGPLWTAGSVVRVLPNKTRKKHVHRAIVMLKRERAQTELRLEGLVLKGGRCSRESAGIRITVGIIVLAVIPEKQRLKEFK